MLFNFGVFLFIWFLFGLNDSFKAWLVENVDDPRVILHCHLLAFRVTQPHFFKLSYKWKTENYFLCAVVKEPMKNSPGSPKQRHSWCKLIKTTKLRNGKIVSLLKMSLLFTILSSGFKSIFITLFALLFCLFQVCNQNLNAQWLTMTHMPPS